MLAPLFLLFVASSSADESIVLVGDLGSAQGILNPLAREFRGLPYAQPPVGALRWNAPARVQSWGTSVFPAINDGPGCLQLCHEPPAACPTIIQEDCLYLNVFTPREPFAKPVPVFVWIHGGNFKDSSGGGVLYNGSELSARQGVVVVSLNYRLGLQGFLFSNKTAEGGGITGNFGLLDQREALRFVQRYIGAFGGDPTRVTLGGQSAGAMSTAVHLISPESAGLYHGAVMLSEPFALPFRTPDSALDMAAVVLAASNCSFATGMRGLPSPAACMRSLTAPELLAVQQKTLYAIAADYRELLQIFMPLCPTTGTPEVPNWPLYSFQGRVGALPVADVPIFLGTTSQEGMLFIYAGFNTTIPPIEYAALMEVIFGPLKGLEVLSHYPLPKTAVDARPTAAVVTTTAIFKCAVRNASLSLSGMPTRKSPIFAYEFSREYESPIISPPLTISLSLYLTHTSTHHNHR